MKVFKRINLLAVTVVLLIMLFTIFANSYIYTLLTALLFLGIFQAVSGVVLAMVGYKKFWWYVTIAFAAIVLFAVNTLLIHFDFEGIFGMVFLVLFPLFIAAYFTYITFVYSR